MFTINLAFRAVDAHSDFKAQTYVIVDIDQQQFVLIMIMMESILIGIIVIESSTPLPLINQVNIEHFPSVFAFRSTQPMVMEPSNSRISPIYVNLIIFYQNQLEILTSFHFVIGSLVFSHWHRELAHIFCSNFFKKSLSDIKFCLFCSI